ncbi:MAG TPA: beta-ketoacyl-ACP synthase II [Myxococcota bacterium]|nr:beta-ketoacyl-ACP synthase II [Myxococcota bacterium]
MKSSPSRRVVITGIGCVTPLGIGVDATWNAAIAGKSGVRRIERFDAGEFPSQIAGEVPGELDLSDVPAKEARRIDRSIALALVASREALESSKLTIDAGNCERIGVSVGSGIGGLETIEEGVAILAKSGPRRVAPFVIPMTICNMTSGYIAIRHGLKGLNLCHVSACATGAHSIGEAARVIERGDADAMLAGGTEAPITRIGVAAFAAMRALSTRNDEPALASRPFDRGRDGFVIAEGAAVLLLEAEEHARARGAPIRARLLGYAGTADAAHIAQPTENAEGAQRCMRLALEDADLTPSDVEYLNAHATSTPAGDPSEARAIRAVFGAHTDRLAVSATKSMTGHLLGAAGAVEATLCIRALESGILPPTINLDAVDADCELDHVANEARRRAIRVALSNSFGFGGTNACLVLGRE